MFLIAIQVSVTCTQTQAPAWPNIEPGISAFKVSKNADDWVRADRPSRLQCRREVHHLLHPSLPGASAFRMRGERTSTVFRKP
jgi:hypothetical protein